VAPDELHEKAEELAREFYEARCSLHSDAGERGAPGWHALPSTTRAEYTAAMGILIERGVIVVDFETGALGVVS
jgi:hypothetical protein